jgi:hypothetical protein
MLRALLCSLLILTACRHDSDPPVVHPQEADMPPLPPSSGTPVGYLVDNASQLNLRDDQITKLKEIDQSLGAKNAEIDTQLRIIEKPEEDPEPERGAPPKRHNNAPGAQIKTTADAAKLHEAHNDNDREALQQAFALLDPPQQATARKLLEDRGVAAPGASAKPVKRDDADGVPLER